jgi:hypothetical protein
LSSACLALSSRWGSRWLLTLIWGCVRGVLGGGGRVRGAVMEKWRGMGVAGLHGGEQEGGGWGKGRGWHDPQPVFNFKPCHDGVQALLLPPFLGALAML